MSGFLYYIPGAAGVNPDTLKEFGLALRLSLGWKVTQWLSGPAGAGALVANLRDLPQYEESAQTWLDCGAWWVGYENAQKPGPLDLQRELCHEGYRLGLLDNNEWTIPRLRAWNVQTLDFDCNLPQSLVPRGGKVIRKVQPSCEALDNLGRDLVHAFTHQEEWDTAKLLNVCAQLLSANYRLGAEEIGLLGLFDIPQALCAVRLAIDEPMLLEHSKAAACQGVFTPPQIPALID